MYPIYIFASDLLKPNTEIEELKRSDVLTGVVSGQPLISAFPTASFFPSRWKTRFPTNTEYPTYPVTGYPTSQPTTVDDRKVIIKTQNRSRMPTSLANPNAASSASAPDESLFYVFAVIFPFTFCCCVCFCCYWCGREGNDLKGIPPHATFRRHSRRMGSLDLEDPDVSVESGEREMTISVTGPVVSPQARRSLFTLNVV